MRFVLDTGVLWRPHLLRKLARGRQPLVVPAIVYMERLRQLARDGIGFGVLRDILRRCRIEVEPFTALHAERFASRMLDDEEWKRLSRDAMIAGHVDVGDVLWTTNPDDFRTIGLAEAQIIDCGGK